MSAFKKESMTAQPIAIYFHPDCADHLVPDHPEKPQRVTESLRLLRQHFPNDDKYFRQAPLATDDHLLLFHTAGHVEFFNRKGTYHTSVTNSN